MPCLAHPKQCTRGSFASRTTTAKLHNKDALHDKLEYLEKCSEFFKCWSDHDINPIKRLLQDFTVTMLVHKAWRVLQRRMGGKLQCPGTQSWYQSRLKKRLNPPTVQTLKLIKPCKRPKGSFYYTLLVMSQTFSLRIWLFFFDVISKVATTNKDNVAKAVSVWDNKDSYSHFRHKSICHLLPSFPRWTWWRGRLHRVERGETNLHELQSTSIKN